MAEQPGLDVSRKGMYSRKVPEDFPQKLRDILPDWIKKISCRYGLNPGGKAALFADPEASGPNMATFEVLQEGERKGNPLGLSYINLGDADLGLRVVKTLHDVHGREGLSAYCGVKHEMPAVVATGRSSFEALVSGYNSDSLSAFGAVHVLSTEVDDRVAEFLVNRDLPHPETRNVEVVFAPFYKESALKILAERKPLRVIRMRDINLESLDDGLEYKGLVGAILVEPRFRVKTLTKNDIEVVSKATPTEYDVRAALFNWVPCAFGRSNCVVIGGEDVTHGVGTGQMSRIDAAYVATFKANGRPGLSNSGGYGSRGTFGGSDAYMPSPDVVIHLHKHGVRGIIYPLGSENDQKVIDAANDRGMIMIATRKPGTQDCERAFMHR